MSDYSSNFPQQRPTLNLDFANSGKLDSRISNARSSTGTAFSSEKHLSSENLLPYSNDLSNASWTKSNTTASSGATGPDGTANASSVLETTANDNHTFYDNFEVVNGVSYTFVAFVKGNGRTKVKFQCQAQPTIANVEFDLTAVTSTVLTGSAVSHAIVASGGTGWYRCSVTVVAGGTGAGYHQIHISDGSSYSYAGDITKGVFIFGTSVSSTQQLYVSETSGQLHREFAPTLKSYSSDQPRFEYSASDGQSVGLKIESSATNLCPQSSDFTDSGYILARATIDSNCAVAPDGTLTADRLVEDATATNSHQIARGISTGLSVGTSKYTLSIYAKAGGRDRLAIKDNNQTTTGATTFDLSGGTVVSGTGAIEGAGNGWYRLSIFPTVDNSATAIPYILLDNGSSTSYSGDSYSGVLLWGLQLETGSAASSLISTSGASASRAADSCSVALSDVGITSGQDLTAVVEGVTAEIAGASLIGFDDGSSSNYARITSPSSGNYTFDVRTNAVSQAVITLGSSATKFAFRVENNNIGASAGGSSVTTDTSATIGLMNTMQIGNAYWATQANGTISRVSIYSEPLTDTNLTALSS